MREVTQEIKDLIREQVLEQIPSELSSNKNLVNQICKQREDLYANNELEVN